MIFFNPLPSGRELGEGKNFSPQRRREDNLERMFRFILTLLLIMFPMPAYADGDICVGKGNINLGNRFEECDKGDIITVAAIVSTQGITNLNAIGTGGMHLDEVHSFCSFEYPIVEVGEIQLLVSNADVPLKWFNCVYLGKERESKIPTEWLDNLEK